MERWSVGVLEYCPKSELCPASAGSGMLKGRKIAGSTIPLRTIPDPLSQSTDHPLSVRTFSKGMTLPLTHSIGSGNSGRYHAAAHHGRCRPSDSSVIESNNLVISRFCAT